MANGRTRQSRVRVRRVRAPRPLREERADSYQHGGREVTVGSLFHLKSYEVCSHLRVTFLSGLSVTVGQVTAGQVTSGSPEGVGHLEVAPPEVTQRSPGGVVAGM